MIRWDPPPDVAAVVDNWDAAQDVVAAVHALEGELSRVFGSLEQRVRLADPRWWERRQGLVRVLPVPPGQLPSGRLARPLGQPFPGDWRQRIRPGCPVGRRSERHPSLGLGRAPQSTTCADRIAGRLAPAFRWPGHHRRCRRLRRISLAAARVGPGARGRPGANARPDRGTMAWLGGHRRRGGRLSRDRAARARAGVTSLNRWAHTACR